MSQLVRERIERLSDLAHARGFGASFDAAVDRILEKLRMSPRESGDPLRNLRGLNMTHFRMYQDALIADYSVHDRISMVVLWSLAPAPDHPLAAPPPNGN